MNKELEPVIKPGEIIGNGDIAQALRELPELKNAIYFASGVSNSQETRQEEFDRERDLLLSQDKDQHIIYFSTLSSLYTSTPYTRHKLHMEAIVKNQFRKSTVVRLGNIDWGTNPHTLINHIKERYKKGLPVEIQDVWRYVVSKDEFLYWMSMIPNWSYEMNIPGRRMKVKDIVKEYVL